MENNENEEQNEFIEGKGIIRFIKSQRKSCLGYTERMEDTRMVKSIWKERLYGRRRRGQP